VGLFNTLVAYTGPYRVDGDKWITMVEVSMNPAWVGTEQTRMFQISGDRLQETSPYMARPDNRMARAVITYERVKWGTPRGDHVRRVPIPFSIARIRASNVSLTLVVSMDRRIF
jgi:hypothetical protein